jgi:hypothetical protein
MGVRAAGEREGAWLGKGVITVKHNAVEVVGPAVGCHWVGEVVVTEGNSELASPAGAAVGGRSTAIVSISEGWGGAEGIVDEVGANKGIVDVGIRSLLFVD